MKKLIIHGGAGNFKTEPDMESHRAGVSDALNDGFSVLNNGGSAVDAVERAVSSMEDNPVFNCGYGSVLDYHGNIQMDAGIMTSELEAGGIVNVIGVEHPVNIARMVMEQTDHVLLGEPGLNEFLDTLGVSRNFFKKAPKRVHEWEELKKSFDRNEFESFPRNRKFHASTKYHSTVGAAALDDTGLIAAATSTGGIRMKMFGRIGDSALFGSGTFANKAGAASATGIGEQIIKITLCRMAVLYMESMPAQEAIDKSLEEARQRGYECGIIGVDAQGNTGYGYTTEVMSCGFIDRQGEQKIL